MCKRKKCLSLLLAAAMLLTLSIPAFAKADSGDSVTHVHEYVITAESTLYSTTYEDAGNTSCLVSKHYIGYCNRCGAPGTVIITETAPHAFQGVSATCNGAKQTLLSVCGNCGHRKTELKICPAAGHGSSPCPALPF